jgi:hypothetical protein
VLLGTVFTTAAISLPARAAQAWQDTALSATAVTDETFGGSNLKVGGGDGVIDLSGTGVTWSLASNFNGVSVSGTTSGSATMSYSGSASTGLSSIYVDATDSNGNAEAFLITVLLGTNTIGFTGTPTLITVSDLTDTNTGNTVEFSAHSDDPSNQGAAYTESNLPTGLTSSGEPSLTYSGMTAAPGTYSGVVVTAKSPDSGAVLKGTFTLTVSANSINTYGNYVNKFGNGLDVYRQQQHPGARIVGWTATQSDAATHFIINNGTHPGAYQIEYAPDGTGTGLCVSDPGGGWASDPLRDGLILVDCSFSPWQQFIRQPDGTLKNVATGLYVNPHGKGAQLRGESSATSWGGSSYTWTPEGSLP